MKLPKILRLYPNEYLTVFAAMIIFMILCIWQEDPTVKTILWFIIAYTLFVLVKCTVYFIISKFRKND